MFDWNDLRYLLAVEREGTLSAAARALGVKHTTVARRIEALERDLGAQLVRRGADKITLTGPGVEVVALAAELEVAAARIELRVAGENQRLDGTVRVTMPDTFAGYVVRQLPALRAQHPDLRVHVLADLRVYDLLAGEADIALRLAPDGHGDLVERKLGVAAWALYASKGYLASRAIPVSVPELLDHDLVGVEGVALAASPAGVFYREHLPDARFAMHANGILPMLNAVLFGAGIAPLPCFLGDAEATLTRLPWEPWSNRRLRLLVPRDVARVPRVRAVLEYLVEILTRAEAVFAGATVGATRPGS